MLVIHIFHSYEEICELQYMCIYFACNHITTDVQTLFSSKTRPSFSGDQLGPHNQAWKSAANRGITAERIGKHPMQQYM